MRMGARTPLLAALCLALAVLGVVQGGSWFMQHRSEADLRAVRSASAAIGDGGPVVACDQMPGDRCWTTQEPASDVAQAVSEDIRRASLEPRVDCHSLLSAPETCVVVAGRGKHVLSVTASGRLVPGARTFEGTLVAIEVESYIE